MVAYPVPLQNKSELRPYSRQTPFATATENEPERKWTKQDKTPSSAAEPGTT